MNHHTVLLDTDKCKGCITCMRRCPTQAIRVRDGKASVQYDDCIGCGECVRLCPHNAKLAKYDAFDSINAFEYKIALPAPALYGQFNNLTDVNYVLNGLLGIGFDDVYEVGRGAELVSEVTKYLLDNGRISTPVISTACPAVVNLIFAKFPGLEKHLLPVRAPVEIAAKLAREKAIARGIPAEKIGVFFISPCPAKVEALKSGERLVDGVISVSKVYKRLLPVMNKLRREDLRPLSKMGVMGLGWAASGGESVSIYREKYLAADGIENVMHILNALEDHTLTEVDFIELSACTSGCVGGVLTVENPFIARARLRALRKKLPQKCNSIMDEGKPVDYYLCEHSPRLPAQSKPGENRMETMKRLIQIEELLKTLPQVDCGMCGAPSCRAYAEDVVNGLTAVPCPKKEAKP